LQWFSRSAFQMEHPMEQAIPQKHGVRLLVRE